jgi:hypothetical protein
MDPLLLDLNSAQEHYEACVNISSVRATNLTRPSSTILRFMHRRQGHRMLLQKKVPSKTLESSDGEGRGYEARRGGVRGGRAPAAAAASGGAGVRAGGDVVHLDADHDVHAVPQLRDREHQRRRVADGAVLRLAGGDGPHRRRLRLPHPHRERALQPPHQPRARHLPPQALQLHVRSAEVHSEQDY